MEKGHETAKGRHTRERILDAAVDLLIRGGREALTLDEVRERTHTSKSQIFHYFPDGKWELVHHASLAQVRRVSGEFAAPLDSLAAWRAWVEHMVRLHQVQSTAGACEVAAVAARVLDPDPSDRAVFGDAMRVWHLHFLDGVEALVRRGELREDVDADAVAVLFSAVLQGGAVLDKATGQNTYFATALRAALGYVEGFVPGA